MYLIPITAEEGTWPWAERENQRAARDNKALMMLSALKHDEVQRGRKRARKRAYLEAANQSSLKQR